MQIPTILFDRHASESTLTAGPIDRPYEPPYQPAAVIEGEMSLRNRLVEALCLAAALAVGASAAAADKRLHEKTLPSNSIWPQTVSDLPADPSVHFGTLPNGMRYAVLRNITPPGQVSFRLRIGAGSIEETKAEQGVAHFLEHMAFRGSTHVAEGDVFKRMERLGAALGADTNAFTAQTETVYKFDVPNADQNSVDEALFLMRETAGELVIKQEHVDVERKVVLSEERLGDTPDRHAVKDLNSFIFKGQPLGDHLTIGDVGVLEHVSAAEIRAFYDRWYRPERATLIVAGDIDPAAIEAKIKAKFSDWKGRGDAGIDPPLGPPLPRSFESRDHFETGALNRAAIAWNKPFPDQPDSKKLEVEDTIRQLALAALNQRLQDMAHGPNPPFVGAGASDGFVARSVDEAVLGVTAESPQKLKAALEQGAATLHAAIETGFSADEFARQAAVFHRIFDAAASGADKRPSPQLADEIAHSVDAGEVFMHPKDQQKLVEEILATTNADTINGVMRGTFAGEGPLLFVSASEPVSGTEEAFKEAFAKTGPGGAAAGETASWPYTGFGAPGKVATRSTVDDLGVTLIGFENGVKLTIKPTTFRDDQVLVNIAFGNGRAGLPADREAPFWALSQGAFIDGGLGKASIVDINRELAARSVQSNFTVGDWYYSLGGTTRPQDLDVELALLTAYLADPGWRPEGFEEARNRMRTMLPRMENTDSSVFQRDAGFLLRDGDKRWKFADPAEVDQASADSVKALLAPALDAQPIEITLVGNVTVEQAIASVAGTLGSLPPRAPSPPVPRAQLLVKFPAGNTEPVQLTHHGRADQSIAFTAWPGPDALGDWHADKDLSVLQAILRQRLFDGFRAKIGGTYSPQVALVSSRAFPDYGYFSAEVETPPDKVALFNETLADIVADLQAKPVGSDEFERARKPIVEGLRKSQQTNEYWLNVLSIVQREPHELDLIRVAVSGLDTVTPASVQQAAQKWLKREKAWHLVISPEAGH